MNTKKEEISNWWYLVAVIFPIIMWGILSLGIMSIVYVVYLRKKDKNKANKIATVFIIVTALGFVARYVLGILS